MTDLAQAGLGHIPVSQALAATLARASEGARATGAADVSLEHVLAALCDDEDAIDVLAASNIDAGRLKSEVIAHLASLDGGAHRARAVTVGASAALLRILEAAAAAARGGRRRDINGAIVLAAIVGDGRSAAAQILQSHGLTFDGAIRALQSALGQPARQSAPALAPAEDVLARARERVQSRSAPSLREIMLDKPHLASRPAPQPSGSVTDFVPAHGPLLEAPPATKLDVPLQPDAPAPAQVPPPAQKPDAAPPANTSDSYDVIANAAEPGPASEPPRAGTEAAAPPPTAAREASADPASAPQPNVAVETGRAPAATPPPSFSPPPFAPPPADGHAARSEPGYAAPAPSADQKKPGGFMPPPPPANTLPRPAAALPHAPHPVPPPPGGAAKGGPQHPFPPQHPPPAQPMFPAPSMSPGSAPLPPVLERASIGPRPPPIPPQVPPPGAAPPPPRPAGGRLAPGSAPPAAPYPSPAPSPMPVPAARAPAMPAPGAPVPPPASGHPAGRAPVQKAELGQMVENVPRVMRVGIGERVEVRLAHAHIKGLTEGLEGGGLAWRHDVTITKAMSVRLRAPEGGFFIETASPETQWIDSQFADVGDDYASWRFMITPQRSGRARLQIIVSARTVGADGLAAETAFPDQIIDLKVRANYVRLGRSLAGWTLAAIAGGAFATFGEGAVSAAAEVFRRLTSG